MPPHLTKLLAMSAERYQRKDLKPMEKAFAIPAISNIGARS
jgi:hypothetical protein